VSEQILICDFKNFPKPIESAIFGMSYLTFKLWNPAADVE
jgi:hypothetical protein